MAVLPRRSRATALTDDELLLLDFMFEWHVPERMLRRDVYPLHMNVDYCHGLDDHELRKTLQRLSESGLVAESPADDDNTWSLTPLGGKQWELERQPRWDAYCQDLQKWHRSGRRLGIVVSPNRETAERFLSVASAAGLWGFRDAAPRYFCITRHELIPWREFPAIHVFAARTNSNDDAEVDWDFYETHRTWWRSVGELDSLSGNVKT
jgi:hypothetical protein